MVTARPDAAQGNFATLTLAVLLLRLRLGQATPGNLGIGEDHGGNCIGFERNFVSCDGFDGGASFMRSLVRKHGLADYVANGVDRGIVSLQLLVDLDESALADLHMCLFQTRDFGIGLAAHGDQNPIEHFLLRAAILRFERGANAGAFVFHCLHGCVEQDSVEEFFQSFVKWKDEIAVGTGKKAGEHLDYRHTRAERGVDGAEFEADVSATDDQQSARNVFEVQGAGGIHHARSVELESGNDRRAGTGRDDDAVEGQRFFRSVSFGDT